MLNDAEETGRVKVWDWPVRLFHWMLVVLVAFSWWSGEEHCMEWHRLSGYAILGLLVFRIYWGFAGSRTARFASFVHAPSRVADYARTLTSRTGEGSDGHNPVGGWNVVAMLAMLAAMVGAGLFAVDVDGFESGPLAAFVTFEQGRVAAEWHEIIFNAILVIVALHVLAVIFYHVWKRQNLIGAMIHGRRKSRNNAAAAPVAFAWRHLLAGIALGAGAAWLAANAPSF